MTKSNSSVFNNIDSRWENLTIANDYVFCKAMLDEDLCKDVIETVLNIQIDRIEFIGKQEPLDASPSSKSVRLDVYVRDGKGTIYDVEMQLTNTQELPRRSRYYHALLALNQIEKGEPYKALKDTFVIFVCCFDPFGFNRRVYSFENVCCDCNNLTLNDGAKTIFLAATAPRSSGSNDRLDEFLDFVSTGAISGELSTRLATAVSNVLSNETWRLEYMMLEVRDQLNFDRGVLQGRAEGISEGIARGHTEGLAEGLSEGRKKGLIEGLEQGRSEGMAEGLEQGRSEGITAGLAQGRSEGMAEGLEQGRSEGLAEGENKLSRLIASLIADGRQDDVARAVCDSAQREALYGEYDIA